MYRALPRCKLLLSCWQSHSVNQVLCAAAHRSLDTVGLETLARHGCLPGTNVHGQPGYHVV